MISFSKPQRSALGAVALLALLAGCQQPPAPVSPAVVNPPPAPPPPPMPSDAELGTPSGTFSALPDTPIAGQTLVSQSAVGRLNFNGRRYHFVASGMNATGFASAVSPVSGNVYNLTNVTDFAGTYRVAAVNANKTEVVLKNEKGVALRLVTLQPMLGNVQEVVIRLTR